ncbi:hypothetical protein [Dyella sp. C11]|uniref:hypothetical protein n=1 Tax=Dyella sp. C11 TaxID=2126991 RepID=UPI000D64FE31|nr:hypothetical protein [Dyella sp. C11]
MKQLLCCFVCFGLAACCTEPQKVETVSLENAISSVRAAIENGYAYCADTSHKCTSNVQLNTVTISLALASTNGQEVDVALPGKYPFSLGGKGTFSESTTNTITLVWQNPCLVATKGDSTGSPDQKPGGGGKGDRSQRSNSDSSQTSKPDPYGCDVAGGHTMFQTQDVAPRKY